MESAMNVKNMRGCGDGGLLMIHTVNPLYRGVVSSPTSTNVLQLRIGSAENLVLMPLQPVQLAAARLMGPTSS